MKRYGKLIVLCMELFIYVLFWLKIEAKCVFKSLFGIACPSCGMTRSWKLIMNGDILESFNYNVFAFPLFIFIMVMDVVIIYDVIKKKNYFNMLISGVVKNYKVIILLIVVSMVINNIRGI